MKNIKYYDKSWLYQKYFKEKLLMSEIASLCNVQRETISKWMKKFGFRGRSPSERHIGKWNGRWKGGRYKRLHSKGRYIFIVRKNGKPFREHRLIIEEKLGRKLSSVEVVHHLDGNSLNNKLENLLLFPNRIEHQRFENTLNSFAKQILYGKNKPTNHKELLSLFKKLLSKNGQNISV